MTKQLGELQVVFGADLKKLESALNRVQKELDSTKSKFQRGFDSGTLNKAEGALNSINGSLGKVSSSVGSAAAGFGQMALQIGVTVGMLAGLSAGVAALVNIASQTEKTRFSMAGLINSTTQFYDVMGRALSPADNLRASLEQSKALITELQKRATDLAGVTTQDLINTAQFALPKLNEFGITDASKQADIIGSITASLNQLGLAFSEVQTRQETLAFLNGKVEDINATFARLVAQTNGGTEAFKRNFEAAKRNGTAYEFLSEAMQAFSASSALAATSLDNKLSVIQDGFARVGQSVGEQLNAPFKELADTVIKQFYTEIDTANGKTTEFNSNLKGTSEEIGQNLSKSISGLGPLIPPIMSLVIAMTRLFAAFAGSTVENNQNVIASLGQLINGLSAFVNEAANRIGGLVKFVTGASQAGIGVVARFGLASLNILPSIASAVANTVIGTLNKMIASINGAIGLLPPAVRDSLGFKPLKAIAEVNFKVKGGENIDKFISGGLSKAGSGFGEMVFGQKSSKLPAGFFDEGSKLQIGGAKSKTTPEDAKDKKGKKGKDPDVAARELANAETELEKEREKTALKEKQLALTEQELKLDEQKANFEASNERQKAIIAEKQGALDIAKQQLDVEAKRIQTEVNAGRITKSQGIELSRQNELKKQSIDYQKDLLEYEKKKLAITEALTNASFDEAENNKKAASAQEKLDSINNQIANQEKLIVDPSIQKDSARVLKEKAELEKLKQARIDAKAELDKIESTIAAATIKDAAKIEALTKEANTFKGAIDQKNSIDIATVNQDAAAKQAAETRERAKTFQKALETGGKNIGQEIESALQDGTIKIEEVFKIGQTVFREIGNVYKSLQGGSNGNSEGGGVIGGLGGLFSLFKGGGNKSSGGSGPSGPSFGTASQFFNASSGKFESTGLADSPIQGGAGGASGLMGLMGPWGAAAAGVLKVGFTIGKAIFGFLKARQEKKIQKAANAFKQRTDAMIEKLKAFDKAVDDAQFNASQADGIFLASTANGIVTRVKAQKSLFSAIGRSIKQREQDIKTLLDDYASQSRKVQNRIGEATHQTHMQLVEQIQQLRRQSIETRKNIEKLYTELGKSLLDFNDEVYFSSFEKSFRDLGKSVTDVLQKGADLIEGGFDKTKVKTLVTNQLKDIQTESMKSLDDTISNAVANRKQFLADKIKALSESISGILKKFGFEKEDTADAQIQAAIRNFNKERQKQEAELLKAEKDAIDNKSKTLSFLNDVIARNLAAIGDKNTAGSTEQFLKNLGKSFKPSSDGLKEASSILQSAVSASIDQSLKQIVSSVRT